MVISSFYQSDFGLRPLKVEVVLVPGLSQIQILGLADQLIKESSKRILSALRHQGFRLPPGQSVLVNLQPQAMRKSSQGLDLAIALGILLESEQIDKEQVGLSETYCYGQLTLKGEVITPPDLKLLNFEKFNKTVITGECSENMRFPTREIGALGELPGMTDVAGAAESLQVVAPPIDTTLRFPEKMARIMEVVAVGEHPLLIAGSAGSGKTTMVEHLATLLNPPAEKLFLEAKKYWMLAGRELAGRPIVQPHHSTTPLAMIGGGRPLRFGEISLAHGGALILDELLEFPQAVQSALREPMEKAKIHLSRVGVRAIFPAQCLVLATTNLCACGNFQPDGNSSKCRCSSLKLRHYLQRLTGPFLDRFALFHLHKKESSGLSVGLTELKERVVAARRFQTEKREQESLNQHLDMASLMEQLAPEILRDHLPFSKSLRRKEALLRVARTLADLEQCELIQGVHLEEAQDLTARDIYKLEKASFDEMRL